MADPIKRLNYFKHQFLRASDFIDEQKYHLQMRRQHNRSLHTWGIAGVGLKVSFVQGATAVKVAEGMAVDSQGREVILVDEKTIELAGFTPGAAVFIVISYAERKTDASSETGAEGDTRWTEEPQLRAVQAKPSDVGTDIILARVNRTGTTVTGVDETDRRTAGVETGELSVRTLRLSRPDVDAGAWPRLTCSAANQAALENAALKIDANREIFFADAGQIRSFDNNHRLVFNRANNRFELHEFGDILFLTGNPPTEKLRIGAAGNVGIGRTAAIDKLEVQGNARAFALSFMDAAGALYPDNWLGMANNVEGATKWLHIGGITDAGARRLALMADRVFINGRLGIGVTAPESQLQISGGQWDVGATEGDLKIGNATMRLKMGVALAGGGAGDARIRVQGGSNRLMLGSGTADVLTIQNGNLGIGTVSPQLRLQLGSLGALNETDGWTNLGSNSYFDGAWKRIDTTKPGVNLHMNANDGAGMEFRFLREDVGTPGRNIAVIGTGLSFISSPLAIGQISPGANVMLDVNGRVRLRQTPSGTSGSWLMGAAIDRAFIGMANENDVGFWGNDPGKPGWGFTMDVTTFKIKSPMWRVIRILEASPGPLPKSVPFVSAGGMMMIFASGSGFLAGTAAGLIGMRVKVDDVIRGNSRGFTNEGSSHKTFVPVLLVEGVAAGAHTLTLEALSPTLSDGNDFFNVTIVEMPI
jgi:hypothetical protein